MEDSSDHSCIYNDKTQISSVIDALNAQRLKSRLCDVILQIFDEQIHAHSNVLAAASPYFDQLFSGQELSREFSPKSPQIIEIHIDGPRDLGYKIAVRRVVDFMYTSTIELQYNVLSQVAEIAKIMQMTNVLGFCQLYNEGSMNNTEGLVDGICQTDFTESVTSQVTEDINNTNVTGLKKRKRGRPRHDAKQMESDEKENLDEHQKSSNEDIDLQESFIERVEQPLKVSKRGRVIKPKVFSDDLLTDIEIKQELLSDDEVAESEAVSPPQNVREHRSFPGGFIKKEMCSIVERSKRYSCDKCDYSSKKVKDFNDHYKAHLHSEKKCSYCGWTCGNEFSQEQFDEHLKKHTGDLPYFCNFCSARFKTRTKFLLHVPKHSKHKPFICEACGAGFKWKHALKNHMIIHKNTKDYLCDICGFSTAHKAQLKAHRLVHTGNTFKCTEPDCDYQATKKTNLQFHMITHTREKAHQCDICGTSFSLVKNLKRHLLLHQNDRPFKCEYCPFSTTRFDKLKEHYYKQHNVGEKPGKKLRVTDYLKSSDETQGVMRLEEVGEQELISIHDEFETYELQVPENVSTPQFVNISGVGGEEIPITIISGNEVTFEVPAQLITQEIVEEATAEVVSQ